MHLNILKDWILPPRVYSILSDSVKKHRQSKKILQENLLFKNKHSDIERCFILATGPSIKSQDLGTLKGELCISVSNFFVHHDYSTIQPKYHVFAPCHKPITIEQYTNWMKEAEALTTFPCTFINSLAEKNLIQSNNLFKNHKNAYYLGGGDFPVDLEKKIPPYRTVAHIAIYLALYLGIKEINLLGVDHSWILHYGKSRHFYEESKHQLNKQGYNEWSHQDFGKLCEGYSKSWETYRNIKKVADSLGVSIINLTKDSLLDVFPCDTLNDKIG